MDDLFGGQPRDVDVQPCYYCGEPTALFSPHAVRKHLSDGVMECMCEEEAYRAEQETYMDPRCGCPDHYVSCSIHGPKYK